MQPAAKRVACTLILIKSKNSRGKSIIDSKRYSNYLYSNKSLIVKIPYFILNSSICTLLQIIVVGADIIPPINHSTCTINQIYK
jgi:hypothetical protein